MSDTTAACTIDAQTYGEAIEAFGKHMDAIYGPNWKLLYAHASPGVRVGTLADPNLFVSWQWDMKGEWLGP